MAQPPFSAIRRHAVAVLAGIALGLAFGALVAWRQPDQPAAVVVTVYTLMTAPIFVFAVILFGTGRRRTESEMEAHAQDVETRWFRDAAATAFATLMGGLVLGETLGDVLDLPWLSPVGLPHALVLGLGSFGLAYLYERRQAR